MDLNCVYKEVFTSKLNKELTFVDSLHLPQQPSSTDAYCIMYWSDDWKVQIPNKTNQQIFDSYCKYISEKYPSLSEIKLITTDYSETVKLCGMSRPGRSETVYYKSSWDIFLEDAYNFFEKYGGIENVEFYVVYHHFLCIYLNIMFFAFHYFSLAFRAFIY